MNAVTLYYSSTPLGCPIDRSLLEGLCKEYPNALLSMEPVIDLPMIDGKPRPGRLPSFNPLGFDLPPEGLMLQEAALYGERTWVVLAAPQPASKWTGRKLIWSLDAFPGCQSLEGITCKKGQALPWQDYKRFGLNPPAQGSCYPTERYYRGAEAITWRILPTLSQGNAA